MMQPPLFPVAPHFDGAALTVADGARLASQLDRVKALMLDSRWRTLGAIRAAVGGTEQSVSARLRDLRKPRFGAFTVERRRVAEGLFEYRVLSRYGTGGPGCAEGHDGRLD